MSAPDRLSTRPGGAERARAWHLRLYVAGQSPKSLEAFANLIRMCEEHLEARYEIEIVDLVENPQLAAGDEIVADPDPRAPAPGTDAQDHRRPV